EAGSDEHGRLIVELDALDDAVDAVRDALLAESAFQLARGRPERAAASLDSVAGGEMPPPELEVLRTPRPGAAATHRVIALLEPEPAPSGWTGSPTSARAAAEPALDAWAA